MYLINTESNTWGVRNTDYTQSSGTYFLASQHGGGELCPPATGWRLYTAATSWYDDTSATASCGASLGYTKINNAIVRGVNVGCLYPAAYPTWTSAVKANDVDQCAALCASLSDCGGFNIHTNGGLCQLCTNTEALFTSVTTAVTAYLKEDPFLSSRILWLSLFFLPPPPPPLPFYDLPSPSES